MMRILLVGLDDTCRTPMFKAVLQQALDQAGQRACVESCGISAYSADDRPMHQLAERCLGHAELAVPDHRSRKWNDPAVQLDTFDYIICMDGIIMEAVGVKIESLNDQREGALPPIQVRLANEEGGGIKPPLPNLGSYTACLAFISVVARSMVGQLEIMTELPNESD